MRVSKEKAAENREALLGAAGKLFRERGIDGVGVAEVAKAAGLTHGALYAHFPSKELLAAEALSHGFAAKMDDIRAWAGDRDLSFADYLGALFSATMRDEITRGCPLTASASEAGRQGPALSKRFSSAFEEEVGLVADAIDGPVTDGARRSLALASIAAHIGAIAVARAVAKHDPALSDDVLRATHDAMAAAYAAREAK